MEEQVRDRQRVFSKDGHKLGRVVSVGAEHFEVERGFFLPEIYLLSLDSIERVDEEGVHLSLEAALVNAQWDLDENYEEPGERRRVEEGIRRKAQQDAQPPGSPR